MNGSQKKAQDLKKMYDYPYIKGMGKRQVLKLGHAARSFCSYFGRLK